MLTSLIITSAIFTQIASHSGSLDELNRVYDLFKKGLPRASYHFVVDNSDSMPVYGVAEPTRRSIGGIIGSLEPGDGRDVIIFDSHPRVLEGGAVGSLGEKLDFLGKRTNIRWAVFEALKRAENDPADVQVILLFTDGENIPDRKLKHFVDDSSNAEVMGKCSALAKGRTVFLLSFGLAPAARPEFAYNLCPPDVVSVYNVDKIEPAYFLYNMRYKVLKPVVENELKRGVEASVESKAIDLDKTTKVPVAVGSKYAALKTRVRRVSPPGEDLTLDPGGRAAFAVDYPAVERPGGLLRRVAKVSRTVEVKLSAEPEAADLLKKFFKVEASKEVSASSDVEATFVHGFGLGRFFFYFVTPIYLLAVAFLFLRKRPPRLRDYLVVELSDKKGAEPKLLGLPEGESFDVEGSIAVRGIVSQINGKFAAVLRVTDGARNEEQTVAREWTVDLPLTGKSYVFKVKDAYLGRRWGRFAGLVFAYAAAVTVLQALGL